MIVGCVILYGIKRFCYSCWELKQESLKASFSVLTGTPKTKQISSKREEIDQRKVNISEGDRFNRCCELERLVRVRERKSNIKFIAHWFKHE